MFVSQRGQIRIAQIETPCSPQTVKRIVALAVSFNTGGAGRVYVFDIQLDSSVDEIDVRVWIASGIRRVDEIVQVVHFGSTDHRALAGIQYAPLI
jgi:hypothetical protein